MINLQEYLNDKLDDMDRMFYFSDHMNGESGIVRDFITEAFEETPGKDFLRYWNMTDIQDMANTFGDDNADIMYPAIMEWLNSPDHDATYYFEQVVSSGAVSTDNFDFMHTAQVAQVEEATCAIHYAETQGCLKPIIAAMYMQNQGYEKVNEELLNTIPDYFETDDLSRAALDNAISEAQEELGLDDKDIGEKSKEDKDKAHDER